MKGNFGKTNFGGIIMHGMNNFGLISRMITDWAYPAGPSTAGSKPVGQAGAAQRHHPALGNHRGQQATAKSRWVLIDVVVKNQEGEKVATGEAMVEFPLDRFCR